MDGGRAVKFVKAVQLVVNPFNSQVCNSKGLHFATEARLFVGRKVDPFCFGESLTKVVVIIARQVINEESDMQGEQFVQDAAGLLLLALRGINTRRKGMVWNAPHGLLPTQTLPEHIIHFMPN